ncbi:MAG: hypothetical protein J6V82_02325 [Clostridia bacterium]|nr:hypothetical protein [Clostridia bacterium]MBO7150566.1 hypothetical protein [Clostridia bacterium]
MTFYQHIGIDVMLGVAVALHLLGFFLPTLGRRIIAAVNIALHGALVLVSLALGCSPEEVLMLVLASSMIALCLGLYEERRANK